MSSSARPPTSSSRSCCCRRSSQLPGSISSISSFRTPSPCPGSSPDCCSTSRQGAFHGSTPTVGILVGGGVFLGDHRRKPGRHGWRRPEARRDARRVSRLEGACCSHCSSRSSRVARSGPCSWLTGLRSRKDPIPFGPFLAAGGAMALFWGERAFDLVDGRIGRMNARGFALAELMVVLAIAGALGHLGGADALELREDSGAPGGSARARHLDQSRVVRSRSPGISTVCVEVACPDEHPAADRQGAAARSGSGLGTDGAGAIKISDSSALHDQHDGERRLHESRAPPAPAGTYTLTNPTRNGDADRGRRRDRPRQRAVRQPMRNAEPASRSGEVLVAIFVLAIGLVGDRHRISIRHERRSRSARARRRRHASSPSSGSNGSGAGADQLVERDAGGRAPRRRATARDRRRIALPARDDDHRQPGGACAAQLQARAGHGVLPAGHGTGPGSIRNARLDVVTMLVTRS